MFSKAQAKQKILIKVGTLIRAQWIEKTICRTRAKAIEKQLSIVLNRAPRFPNRL